MGTAGFTAATSAGGVGNGGETVAPQQHATGIFTRQLLPLSQRPQDISGPAAAHHTRGDGHDGWRHWRRSVESSLRRHGIQILLVVSRYPRLHYTFWINIQEWMSFFLNLWFITRVDWNLYELRYASCYINFVKIWLNFILLIYLYTFFPYPSSYIKTKGIRAFIKKLYMYRLA